MGLSILVLALVACGCAGGGRAGDPAALAFTIDQDAIDRGVYSPELLFSTGLELFVHEFSCAEGGGKRVGGACVHDRLAGPEAQACVDCHDTPMRDGGGTLATNIFRGGTGFADGIERNAPHLFGAGYVELLAREMTAELASERSEALARAASNGADVSVALTAKGVSFGALTAHPDGTITAAPDGIDADLVVRPFMAKGIFQTIRAQNLDAFPGHLGILPDEIETTPDQDGDGVRNELSPGRLTAVVAYEALLASPSYEPVSPRADRGLAVFQRAGCASCHVPFLWLNDPRFTLTDPGDPSRGFVLDLSRDVELPLLPRVSDSGPVLVPLFSDLKRHDLGAGLADPISQQGVPPEQFLTTRLWGVGATAPYLHDGRAVTLDDAILLHDGEARAARDAFAALSPDDHDVLIQFLSSLTLKRGGPSTADLPPGIEGY